MRRLTTRIASLLVLSCAVTLAAAPVPGRGAQNEQARSNTAPSIWQDPGVVEELDFAAGPGGLEKAPQPPFTFIEEDTDGSNPKIKVRDAAGRTWGVKWGSEVHAEVFASRIAWAAGYYVEPNYFVKAGKVEGVGQLHRAKKAVGSDGSFTAARFELKEKGIDKLQDKESWRWDRNPFVGKKELNGLKIVLMLTSNWDSKDQRDVGRGSNTAIFKAKKTGETRYVVTDWGGSMGKWGSYISREKWDCKEFAEQNKKFITGVKGGSVEFGYSGQHTDDVRKGISARDVAWVVGYLSRISDSQLRAGLEASGATEQEVSCFTSALRDRINQLKSAAAGR